MKTLVGILLAFAAISVAFAASAGLEQTPIASENAAPEPVPPVEQGGEDFSVHSEDSRTFYAQPIIARPYYGGGGGWGYQRPYYGGGGFYPNYGYNNYGYNRPYWG